MELNKRDINFQTEVHRLFGENQILLHQKNKLINELDQYKTAHDKLTAGLKEAVEESIQYKRERDSLIKDVEQQRELLKDFSRFIHRKVEVCPGKKEYMDFRDRLNELGIRERD